MDDEEEDVEIEEPVILTKIGFTKGVLYYMISDYTDGFGQSLRHPILGPFNFNKLHLSRKDLTGIASIFGGIQNLLTPVGGVVSDLISNKFYALLASFAVLFVSHSIFTSLTIPEVRVHKWALIYASESIKAVALAMSEPLQKAFVMDQFMYPSDQSMLIRYIHLNNIIARIISILGFWISPWMKTRIPCLGEQDCFLIPYAIFLILFLISKAVFLSGRNFYVMKKPDRETVTDVFPCIWYGFVYWVKERKTDPQQHWMDHALVVYDEDVVYEAKALLRIMFLDIRLPFMMCLNFHHDLLAVCIKMKFDWRLGKKKLIPDHINLLVPVVGVLTWLALGNLVEPHISNTIVSRPLRRIFFGYCIDIVTNLYYVILASVMMTKFPVLPGRNEGQLRIINGAECPCVVKMSKFINESIEVSSYGTYKNLHVPVEERQTYSLTVHGPCFETSTEASYLIEEEAVTVYIRPTGKGGVRVVSYVETVMRPLENALPYISVLGADLTDTITLVDHRLVEMILPPASEEVAGGSTRRLTHGPRIFEALPDKYKLYRNGRVAIEFDTNLGGVYHVLLVGHSGKLVVMAKSNFVHFGWWLPALVLQDASFYMVAVGEADVYYPETPPSLRGITFSLRCLLYALGNFLQNFIYVDISFVADIFCYAIMKTVVMMAFLLSATCVESRFDDRILY